jgi:hypothetical protein
MNNVQVDRVLVTELRCHFSDSRLFLVVTLIRVSERGMGCVVHQFTHVKLGSLPCLCTTSPPRVADQIDGFCARNGS